MRWLALLLALACALPAAAQDPPPLQLRIAVAPDSEVWVGQHVRVTVTALTPVRFADPPAWPDLVFGEGRAIVLPEATTTPGSERVGGQTLAALQRTFAVFPSQPGPLVIQPLTMRARVGGAEGQAVQADAASEPARIVARMPQGVASPERLVVAPSFRMTAEIVGDASAAKVGEAIQRRLRMEATDTAAMLLPPPAWDAPDGLRGYPDPPRMQDRTDRGELRATRTDSIAYVPQRPGWFELPGFSVTWLEPRSGRAQEVRVEPVAIEVAATEGTAPTAAGGIAWTWIAAAAGAALVALAALLVLRRRRAAEPKGEDAFAALERACRADDAGAALGALYRWCDSVLPPGGDRTLARLGDEARVPDLAQAAAALEAHLLAPGGTWQGAPLLAAARATRTALGTRRDAAHRFALPPLNPGRDRASPVLPPWLKA